MQDRYILELVNSYLKVNGDFCVVPTEGNGDCLFAAMHAQLDLPPEDTNFTVFRFRLQAVMVLIDQLVKNKTLLRLVMIHVTGSTDLGIKVSQDPSALPPIASK